MATTEMRAHRSHHGSLSIPHIHILSSGRIIGIRGHRSDKMSIGGRGYGTAANELSGSDNAVLYSKHPHDLAWKCRLNVGASTLLLRHSKRDLAGRGFLLVCTRGTARSTTAGALLVMTEFIRTAIRIHGVDESTPNIAQSIRDN